jgi:molybdenum cofactor guanylyltransferase
MRLLGAVVAGGSATRFGADKAAALLDGKPLIEHAIDALAPQVETICIIGRRWKDWPSLPDFPGPGGGPLQGLCAALRYAEHEGFDAVLACGCDTLPIPSDLAVILGGNGPAVIDGHWLFGFWPAQLAKRLEAHITRQSDHSLRSWIAVSDARCVPYATPLQNINTKRDLEAIILAGNAASR